MKLISLNKGKFTKVSDEDFEWLNKFHWFIDNSGYARTKVKQKVIRLHVLINNTPKGFFTDHINRDRLDNRRENLRTVTYSLSNINRGLSKSNKFGIKGISWHKETKKWQAHITLNKKQIYLGIFSNLELATKARKDAEILYFKT